MCDSCVADKSRCDKCTHNPKYADVPTQSLYQAYIPVCPRGYEDCIRGPAYIKYAVPGYYEQLFGDKALEEGVQCSCQKRVEDDPDEKYCCYDN